MKKTFQKIPEIWEYSMTEMKERGVPTPNMILNCQPPNFKDKNTFKNEEFNWRYPDETRIKPFEWNLSEDEVFKGIVTNITHDTPQKSSYGKEHLVSIGVGK